MTPPKPMCATALVYHKVIVRPSKRIVYLTDVTRSLMLGVIDGPAMGRVCAARTNNDNRLMGKA